MAAIAFAVAAPSLLGLSGVAGATFAAAAASAAGAAIGSYIDQRFIMPAIFPTPTQKGPRLGDMNLSAAEEGTGYPLVTGTTRVPGVLIWTSDLIEVQDTSHGGGKGGSGGDFVQYKYFAHVAVGICETPLSPISRVTKILADGKKIYDVNPDVTITSALLTATRLTSVTYTFGQPYTTYYLKIVSPLGGPDLKQFKSGKSLTISGWTTAANNGTFIVEKAGTTSVVGETYVKVRGPTPNVDNGFATEAAGATVTLYQKGSQWSAKHMAGAPQFYLGNTTDVANTIIDNVETGPVPAFRNRAYVVLNQLALFDYGNRLPNFEFIVEADVSATVGTAIARYLQLAGYEESEYDVSACTATLDGYSTLGEVEPVAALGPLMLAFDIVAQQQDSKLVFVPRASAPTLAILPANISAHEPGSSAPRRISTEAQPGFDIPTEVLVRFVDKNKNYNGGAERDRRRGPLKVVEQTVDLAIAMDSDDARGIASRVLWTSYVNRQRVKFTTSADYIGSLKEGTRCTFTLASADGVHTEDYSILVETVDRGVNWLLEVTGVVEDVRTLSGYSVGSPSP